MMDDFQKLDELYQNDPETYMATIRDDPLKYLPIIYTPTIGEVCQNFSKVRKTNPNFCPVVILDKENRSIEPYLDPKPDVIVLTDGSRILGLGDLGVNGAPISVGKCRVYQVLANIKTVLPVMVDFGTNNEELRNDPDYIGLREERNIDISLLDDIVQTVFEKCPDCVFQFEDVENPRCFEWLDRYRDKYRVFNDDIQGTAGVVLAGFINAKRILGRVPNILMVGAGSASIGCSDLWLKSKYGESEHIWMCDSKGLLHQGRTNLRKNKLPFVRQVDNVDTIDSTNLAQVVELIQPDILVGLTAQSRTFSKEVLSSMKVDKPIIMALSNPNSKAECTPSEAFGYTDNRAIYASGSMFAEFPHNQANNMFIFPALGKIGSKINTISDQVFIDLAEKLANQVTPEELNNNMLYPNNKDIGRCIMSMVE